jgi:hypothetical protein
LNDSSPVYQPTKLDQETAPPFTSAQKPHPATPAPSQTSKALKQPAANVSVPQSNTQPVLSNSALPPAASAVNQYKTLIDALNFLATSSNAFVSLSDISTKTVSRWGAFWSVSGKLMKYLQAAAEAKVITLRGSGNDTTASLHPSLRTNAAQQSPQVSPQPSPQPHDKFQPIVTVFRGLTTNPNSFILLSRLGEGLARQFPGCYKAAGFPKLKQYVEAAQKVGLLEFRGTVGFEELRLKVWSPKPRYYFKFIEAVDCTIVHPILPPLSWFCSADFLFFT